MLLYFPIMVLFRIMLFCTTNPFQKLKLYRTLQKSCLFHQPCHIFVATAAMFLKKKSVLSATCSNFDLVTIKNRTYYVYQYEGIIYTDGQSRYFSGNEKSPRLGKESYLPRRRLSACPTLFFSYYSLFNSSSLSASNPGFPRSANIFFL